MKRYGGTLRDNQVQTGHAAKLERELHEYAKSIGCTFVMDEVICDEEQWALLAEWWKQHTA